MITDLDKNKNNSIDFEEFLDMMTARMSDRDTREDINKVFRLFDDDGTGTISIRNLRRVARELGETMTDEELQEMIDRADSNGDSAVTPDDFYNIMTKKTSAVSSQLVSSSQTQQSNQSFQSQSFQTSKSSQSNMTSVQRSSFSSSQSSSVQNSSNFEAFPGLGRIENLKIE